MEELIRYVGSNYPTILKLTIEHLNKLSSLIDDATMSGLNAEVDVDKKSVTEVAKGFLTAKGLI